MVWIFYYSLTWAGSYALWFIIITNTFGAFIISDICMSIMQSRIFFAEQFIWISGSIDSIIRAFNFTSIAINAVIIY